MVSHRIGGGIRRFVPLSQREGRKNPKPTWFWPYTELDPHEPGNWHRARFTGLPHVTYAAARLRRYRSGQLCFFGNRILVKRKRKTLMVIPFWGQVIYKPRKHRQQ